MAFCVIKSVSGPIIIRTFLTVLYSPHSKTYTTSPFQRILWRTRRSYIFSGWPRLFRLLPTSITLSTRSVTTLGTFRDWMMSISYGSSSLFSLDLVRTYARTFTLWVTEIAVVGCIAQLFYAWRMYKFSKKARWLCITLSVVRVLKNVLYCSLKTISSSKIAFAQFAAAICCGIQVRNSGHYSNLQKNSKVRVTAIVSGSSFCFVFNHL